MDIGVRVLNGHRDEMVMVPAQPLSGIGNLYCIIDHDRYPGLELEFTPGQLVTAIDVPDSEGGSRPVAYRVKGFPL